ncbi:hypothetical protein HJFPF1_03036 [Paramyrothecium foliicola]|nr:hypothetical protein HJFPF1_03036 [Paramyrothecium foliicola]
MAPVPPEASISYQSVTVAASHLAASVWLTVKVARSLDRSNREIAPAQDTRQRSARRSRNVPIFGSLALLSLAWAVYSTLRYATLSYRVWASERQIDVPLYFHGRQRYFAENGSSVKVHIAQWLSETPVYLDAAEILAEKARRFWWAQQIDLSLISWTMLLAIEGGRRNIPLLWCYQLLAQLVSLPYAQNLFFVALLVTPSPLPQRNPGTSRLFRGWNRVFKPKPSKWAPHPLAYLSVLLLNLCAVGAAPLFANTPTFAHVVAFTRLISFTPIVLPYILPSRWGTIQKEPHDAYSSYTGLFRTVMLFSIALHAKATLVGLAYNAPESHVHRHSIHLPFDVEKRSAWESTRSAFSRILSATSDHPVVSKVGWDVLLSSLSLGLWAAIRVTNVLHVLTYPVLHPDHQDAGEEEESEETDNQVAVKNRHSAKKDPRSTPRSDDHNGRRRRGRAQAAKSITDEDTASDSDYEPTPAEAAAASEGDVLPSAGDDGWESAALAWGLTVLGGLGVGSAAVFGAESIAR